MTEGLQLLVAGDQADVAAAELRAFLNEIDPDRKTNVVALSAADDALRRKVDPIAVAALILSIPPAVLAVIDLADRIAKRQRAAQIIERAKEIEIEKSVKVRIVTQDGTKGLGQVTIDELLEIANPD
ncbi:MAG: hypothetical protein AAFY56_11755 [Pseudomonadota bacterium]